MIFAGDTRDNDGGDVLLRRRLFQLSDFALSGGQGTKSRTILPIFSYFIGVYTVPSNTRFLNGMIEQ